LREIEPKPGQSTREDFEVKEDDAPPPPAVADAALQSIVVAPLAATGGVGFDGVGEGNGQFVYDVTHSPPDTVGEAGLTQYVQWVNPSFAIFDKTNGNLLYGPAGGNTIWTGFGGPCETRNDGDPMVQYDQLADRWIMTQFALQSGNYMQCVAVSQSADATGAWYRYAFSYSQFPDYPKLAVWPDGYYITFNMFSGQTFTGGQVCAYDRAKMLNGLSATQICRTVGNSSLLASDLEGKTLPPAGRPNYVMSRGGSTTLNLWRFIPNFTNGTAVFTGPTSINVSAFTAACSKNCVPQPASTQLLDALGDRLMYRLSYRNLGNREALLVNHSVVAEATIGVRWYEINITNDSPSIRQQSTYAPADGQYRWMGSVAMDKIGNIALGYSIGSSTQRPSIRFAGREATDPLNTLSTDSSLQDGTGSQQPNLSRWGDYSTMSIDPVDDCTFYYTSEYLKTDGTWNWSTRVGTFKFPSCAPPPPALSLSATPASRTITQGQSTTFQATVTPQNGYSGTGSFAVTGLPAGATPTFTPATYSNGNGSSTLSISTAPDVTTGTYPLTITATDTNGTPTQTASATLVINTAPLPPNFTLGATPSSRTITQGQLTSFAATVTAQNGYTGSGSFSVTGLPAGANPSFAPADFTGGEGSTTLSISTTAGTTSGTYPLTITATDPTAGITKNTSVTLVINAAPVQDFTMAANPGSLVLKRGKSGNYTVTVTPSGGFSEVVSFSVSGLPSSTSASFSQPTVTGGGSTSLTIVTNNPATPKGTFALTITGTSPSKVHSVTVTLKVQ